MVLTSPLMRVSRGLTRKSHLSEDYEVWQQAVRVLLVAYKLRTYSLFCSGVARRIRGVTEIPGTSKSILRYTGFFISCLLRNPTTQELLQH
jgi:hypothetical protein